ncbi:hypothetical protein L226DRAFT_575346 [Lentinus tigrinus ALCF2SS1-7]|uniref:Fungal-type protein kinase domain-containing protein n=1 Tax=Lentinus tigrinus ALCF2SS1-6 TaxID=1328759 RepID=A0A5C2RUV7_9APHY|nr:hypothetical protein L227DRAFT_615652 [Lentinus tigrinus ALCF2SS1-6]RPD69683.1 hypothetical protein L226DRAFT_575346 [Lentinus tigrinus ALCF2SS1-7]
MSFSSSSLRSSACSSSGMAESKATPHKHKGPRYANGKADVYSTGASAQGGWASELDGRILVADIPLEQYLDNMVPCSSPYESADITLDPNAFSEYQPGKGLEVQCTPVVRAGLEALVSSFDNKVRPTFWDSHKGDYRFPLTPFAVNHSKSSPDISVSFPGVTEDDATVRSSRWEVISMCIEAKDTDDKDPFPVHKSGKSNMNTIIQIARNARTLMLVHGFLYSFVLGIYGDTVRIARFDRTVCIVSLPFSLHKNLHILQRFFWHFTHPMSRSHPAMVIPPVVGCDPTIRPLTAEENAWLQRHLSRARVKRTGMDVFMTRRVEVYDDHDGTMVPYFVYQLVDVNPRLMSRSTMVWRAIKDTYEEDKRAVQSVKSCILKESWRQLVRRPEADFYRRMAATISDEERWGLPKMSIGGDIGQLELRLWEMCSPNAEDFVGEHHLRLPAVASAVDSSPPSTAESQVAGSSLAATTTDPTTPPSADTPSESSVPSQYPYPFSSPLPWPQHQTFTWSIILSSHYAHRERSHMRFVMEDLGRPLSEFRDTRELVLALSDAIRGHRLAWEKAGILHRDVSLGNILIVDEPNEAGYVGFLHDFDYSSMTDAGLGERTPASTSTAPGNVDKPELKERTDGVVHRVHHDLESYYWLLLWLVLRHTRHNLGHALSEEVFEFGDLSVALKKKMQWLWGGFWEDEVKLVVQDNAPLTSLMANFKRLVMKMCHSRYESDLLTHQSVLDLFDQALAQPGWPTNDRVECTLLDPRFQQDDAEGLRKKPVLEIRRMVVSDSAILKKRSGTVAALDVPPTISEEGVEAEAGPSTLREDGPSNSKRRKSESQAAAMGPPPSLRSLLGPSPLARAAARAKDKQKRSKRSKRS